jgi:hypothetical protein
MITVGFCNERCRDGYGRSCSEHRAEVIAAFEAALADLLSICTAS